VKTLLLLALLLAAPVQADRIKDIARYAGPRSNQLTGYGLVVGLAGGGDENLEYTVQSIKSAAARMGVALPFGVAPGLKNAAAVMITADLPAFAKPGQRIDVTVSAFGKAKSLRGGTLLMAPLAGADGEIYALAQGSLAVAGFGAEGKDGSKMVVNTPTTGRIPNGASVEREVANPFASGDSLTLNLNDSDYTTATVMAAAVNAALGGGRAAAVDAMSVRVSAPTDPAARIALASFIENLDIAAAVPPARIVVNAATGTIVIGGNVRVLPTAVAHGSLTVRVSENDGVSQPGPFSNGRTEKVAQSNVDATEAKGHMQVFAPGVALSDLVDAVNALGAAPGDLVAILEALKTAGALRAELVII
jgi:flagellar P-ring protein precursor FlgI